MWNTTNNTVINSPANGIIQKSNKDSFMLKMHHASSLARNIFDTNPKYDGESISIIQVLLIHEGWILVEAVHTDKL